MSTSSLGGGAHLGIVVAPHLPTIARVLSPHCQRISRPYTQCVVLHATDGHEDDAKPGDGANRKAEQVAAMLARPDLKPRRSAHYVVDSDSIVQCVDDMHIAWHAGSTANARGIGIELCGRAAQTREQWLDAVSLAQLQLAARLVAQLCHRFSIPRQFVPAGDLVRGVRGITTHDEVRRTWHETHHTDPGPHFPLLDFVRAVQLAGPEAVS